METKNIKPLENFDWDAFENDGKNAASVAEETKAYESTLNNVSDNEVIDGKVIAINDREVVVNIGYKSDGIIARNEFRYCPDLQVGDNVEVYIENQEDRRVSWYSLTKKHASLVHGTVLMPLSRMTKSLRALLSAALRVV